MKINLKKLKYQLNTLDMVCDDLKNRRFVGTTGATTKDLKGILDLVNDIESELRNGGESIVELDKDRLSAIKEADEN